MRAHLYTFAYRYIRPLPPLPPPAYRGATEGPRPPSYVGSSEERPCPDLGLCIGREEGGGGLAGPPLLLWSPMVPAKGGKICFKLKSSCAEGTEEKFEPVLKQLKRRRGGGGPPMVISRANASLGGGPIKAEQVCRWVLPGVPTGPGLEEENGPHCPSQATGEKVFLFWSRPKMSWRAHRMVLETTPRDQGSGLSSATMIPQMTAVADLTCSAAYLPPTCNPPLLLGWFPSGGWGTVPK